MFDTISEPACVFQHDDCANGNHVICFFLLCDSYQATIVCVHTIRPLFLAKWHPPAAGSILTEGGPPAAARGRGLKGEKAFNYSLTADGCHIRAPPENTGTSSVLHMIHTHSELNLLSDTLTPELCHLQFRMHTPDMQGGTLSNSSLTHQVKQARLFFCPLIQNFW